MPSKTAVGHERTDLRPQGCTDPALLEALATPATYGERLPVVVHETHASWVFVAGEHAYKIKKPVALGFLDYSTLARRHAACLEEVRVNQDLAADIYLGVRAIVKSAEGFCLAGEGAANAVEYAVEMRRFDERDTMAGLIAAGALTLAHIQEVARCLASFHRSASPVPGGGPSQVLESWRTNLRELEGLEHPDRWQVDVIDQFGAAFVRAHTQEIEQRARDRQVREGHGDLRCEHVLVSGVVRVVDRIEFDPALRRADVACDLAFLTMDLEARGQRRAAQELINAYGHAGASPGSEALRSFYAAHRALVRAKVTLIDAAEHTADARRTRLEDATRLWALAEELCWRARRPLVIVVCGPAGSGKSTLAGELARRSQLAVVSSDATRKRHAGLRETDRAGPEHYTSEFTHATYDLLSRSALGHLRSEGGVIVDATCRTKGQRAQLMARLGRHAATRVVVHCQVTLETALARAAQRMQSSQRRSDATPRIVAEQFRSFEPVDELPSGSVLALDAEQTLDVQVAEVTRAVDERLGWAR